MCLLSPTKILESAIVQYDNSDEIFFSVSSVYNSVFFRFWYNFFSFYSDRFRITFNFHSTLVINGITANIVITMVTTITDFFILLYAATCQGCIWGAGNHNHSECQNFEGAKFICYNVILLNIFVFKTYSGYMYYFEKKWFNRSVISLYRYITQNVVIYSC